jgi:hypothetical protein
MDFKMYLHYYILGAYQFVSPYLFVNGFLAGGRELRQGDPMSPYLFVLFMEVFFGLMGRLIRESYLRFQGRCEREQLTHLCFIDDLMIFCHAEVRTIFWLKTTLINLESSRV